MFRKMQLFFRVRTCVCKMRFINKSKWSVELQNLNIFSHYGAVRYAREKHRSARRKKYI